MFFKSILTPNATLLNIILSSGDMNSRWPAWQSDAQRIEQPVHLEKLLASFPITGIVKIKTLWVVFSCDVQN